MKKAKTKTSKRTTRNADLYKIIKNAPLPVKAKITDTFPLSRMSVGDSFMALATDRAKIYNHTGYLKKKGKVSKAAKFKIVPAAKKGRIQVFRMS